MYPVAGGVSVEEWHAIQAEVARKKEEERIVSVLLIVLVLRIALQS